MPLVILEVLDQQDLLEALDVKDHLEKQDLLVQLDRQETLEPLEILVPQDKQAKQVIRWSIFIRLHNNYALSKCLDFQYQ